jgi:IS5 family transposase
MFMALSADTRPHFTTIADFVSSMRAQIEPLFRDVLLICGREGLIGKEMFAVDGCKISSNCSKEWSGTREEFAKRKRKVEKSIRFLLGKHRQTDKREPKRNGLRQREQKTIARLKDSAKKLQEFLDDHDDKPGAHGGVKQSNITDNDSAKMKTSHGVIQGYNGQAVVDSKRQVVVHAEAFGQGHEAELLKPMLGGVRENLEAVGEDGDVFKETVLTADAGYHSAKNVEMLEDEGVEAYVADRAFRQRDERFEDAQRYKKRPIDGKGTTRGKKYFRTSEFKLDKKTGKLICPAGNPLYSRGPYRTPRGEKGTQYLGWKTKCRTCELKRKCMRNPNGEARAVVVMDQDALRRKRRLTEEMIKRFDSVRGRWMYGRRLGTVEPVFANITNTLGLNWFSLRGKAKVDIQWKLFCMVHNLLKIWRYGPAFA